MHTLKPLDVECLNKVSVYSTLLVTVEEHSRIGGLGGAVAEYISEKDNMPPLVKIGVGDFYCKLGDMRYCWEQHGLTAPQIAERIKNELNKKNKKNDKH